MIETLSNSDLQTRRELVARVVSSSAICKSARLKDLFLYLCHRALDGGVSEIHELELGHKVFGRPERYDTIADNIVRVHASLLRKRLAEYFETEGASEAFVITIPRGNYAPVFHKRDPHPGVLELSSANGTLVLEPRSTLLEETGASSSSSGTVQSSPRNGSRWQLWALASLTLTFALLCVVLLLRERGQPAFAGRDSIPTGTSVRQFWSALFSRSVPTQIVLDDASLDFYQEATGHSVTLAEYFDRSYLRPMEKTAADAHLDPGLVHAFLARRQSNFADVNLVGGLSQTANAFGSSTSLQFARDFSFHQLKSGDIVLLGTRQSNAWIQTFDSYLAIRWKYNPALESYYPIDAAAGSEPGRLHAGAEDGKSHDGYAGIAFLPNLGGTGNVLILTGSGGAALGTAVAFLNNEPSMDQLRARLPPSPKETFPYFETLIRLEKEGGTSRFGTIVLARSPQLLPPAGMQSVSPAAHP